MAENYAKAQRNKRDLDRTMKTLDRENKIKVQLINNEKQAVDASLLDLQSKSKNLSDTITFITSQLVEEKKKAEEQLTKMSIEQSNARNMNDGNETSVQKIRKRIDHCNDKLEWLDNTKPAMKQSMKVMDILTSKKKGFGEILTRIRAKNSPSVEATEPPKAPPKTPKDICSLIDHFKTLPKIYPKKPKKKQPKPTVLMLEKYEEKKKAREKAMSYGTRQRLRRVEFHCETIKELFLPMEVLNNA